MITFYMDHIGDVKTFTAIKGMTWEQWINSEHVQNGYGYNWHICSGTEGGDAALFKDFVFAWVPYAYNWEAIDCGARIFAGQLWGKTVMKDDTITANAKYYQSYK